MLGLPPIYRDDNARLHQATYNNATAQIYNANGQAPSEAWVQRQLPFYEDRYTAPKKCTMLVTTFNVGCKPPPPLPELQLLVQKELLGKAPYYGCDISRYNNSNGGGGSGSPSGEDATQQPSVSAANAAANARYQNTTPMDFIVVGLQEVDMSAAALWKEETDTAKPWIAGFKEAVGADTDANNINPNNDYFMMPPKQLVGLLLLFFVRKPIGRHVEGIGITAVPTGTMGTLGNKGCVAIRFQMHKSSYCVINAHLAAGQEHVSKRNDDMHTILTQLDFNGSARGGQGVGSGGGGGVNGGVIGSNMSGGSGVGAGFASHQQQQMGAAAHPQQMVQTPSGATAMVGSGAMYMGSSGGLTPQDHDLIVFLGDLNYRVDIGYAEGIAKAVEGDYEYLLRRDQLLREMTNPHTPFKGFTDHTPAKFPPTYRFDVGTNNYDTSEKKRVPAYTDRILHWAKNTRHRSVYVLASDVKREIMSSDHKPYCCVLSVPYREEVPSLRRQVENELRAKVSTAASLDRVSAAKVSVNVSQLDFGTCTHYTQRTEHTVTFTNEGECVAVITTRRAGSASTSAGASSALGGGGNRNAGGDDDSNGMWLRCRPLNFEILPGESRTVTVECYLNRQSLGWINKWSPFTGESERLLKSLLLFAVENGPLSAVECSVRVKPSVFCNSLDNLLKLGSTPCAEAYQQGPSAATTTTPASPNTNGTNATANAAAASGGSALIAALPRIPKEVWYLCEAILRRAATEKDLFTTDTEWSDVASVMVFLDTHNEPIPFDVGTSFGLAQCLIDLLKNLQDPVIPFSLYRAALNSTKSGKMPLQIIHEQLPAAHCNLFIYLIGFLRRLLLPNYARQNELDASALSQIFSKILLLRPHDSRVDNMLESEIRAMIHQDQLEAAKFLQFFLGASGGR